MGAEDVPLSKERSMDNGWRRNFITAAGFGGGATLVAVICLAGILLFRSQQRTSWDRHAVVASYYGLKVNTASDGPLVDLSYVVRNNSQKDYLLPTDDRALYFIEPKSHGMYRFKGGPDPYAMKSNIEDAGYIPAGRSVIVTIHLKYAYNESYPVAERDDTAKMAPYMGDRLSYIDGMTVLDRATHYEIDLPKGWKDTVPH